MKKIILTFFLLVTSAIASAGGDFRGKINFLEFYQGHTGLLINMENMADPDGCGRSELFILPETHPHYKDIYALLLAQRFNEGVIRVVTSGCHQGLPSIVHVFV